LKAGIKIPNILNKIFQIRVDNSLPEIDFKLNRYGQNYQLTIEQIANKKATFFLKGTIEVFHDVTPLLIINVSEIIKEKIKKIKIDKSEIIFLLQGSKEPESSPHEIPIRWACWISKNRLIYRLNGICRSSEDLLSFKVLFCFYKNWFLKPSFFYIFLFAIYFLGVSIILQIEPFFSNLFVNPQK